MTDQKASATLRTGWILLLLMSLLIVAGSVESLWLAYRGPGEVVAGSALNEAVKGNPDLLDALRGRRATAASYALTSGLLLGWIALTAFRRRERWAWFALLTSVGLGALASALRYFVLGVPAGASTAAATLAVLILALAISYRDFR
jgi:hypothetical protein